MPTVCVDVDVEDVLSSCSDHELRDLIKRAGERLHKRKPEPESDYVPKDIHRDVGRRELRELIDKSYDLSRHALYVATELGL